MLRSTWPLAYMARRATANSYPAALTITNPGFETGTATGWTTLTGTGPQIQTTTPHSGTYRAIGGNTSRVWWGQVISIPSTYHSDVDAGLLAVNLKAWHLGFGSDTDNGALMIECRDGSGNWLADHLNSFSDPTSWTQETASMWVPPNTREIRISTRNHRVTGTNNDSYWDDFEAELALRGGSAQSQLYSNDGTSTTGWTLTTGTNISSASAGTWSLPGIRSTNQAMECYRDLSIDSAYHSAIDAGTATLRASYTLGTDDFSSDNNVCRLWYEARDGSSGVLATGESAAGLVEYAQEGTFFEQDMTLPAGTRSVRLYFRTEDPDSGQAAQGFMSRISLQIAR